MGLTEPAFSLPIETVLKGKGCKAFGELKKECFISMVTIISDLNLKSL